MPEAVAPVVATPSPQTPAQSAPPVAPVAPVAPAADASAELKAQYKKLQTDHEKKVREHIVERRRWEAEKKSVADRLTEFDKLQKAQKMARANPAEYLKSIYGDNWYETVVETKLNGVPPAQLMQAELEKMREEYDAKLEELNPNSEKAKAAAAQRREEEQKAQIEGARKSLFAESAAFYREAGKDYPILEKLGAPPAIARTIAQRIESEFNRTHKVDPQSGEVVQQGRILSAKEAAELIENDILGIATHAFGVDKYKPKFQKPLTPETSKSRVGGPQLQQQGEKQKSHPAAQQRRTLTNEITGSTPERKPPASVAEKRQRALAAFEAARNKRTE